MVPIPLLPSGTGDGVVRCVKADELAVEGLDWVATDVPSHHVLNLVETPAVDTRTVEKDLA
jgi:peptide/nickel transport system permease protein